MIRWLERGLNAFWLKLGLGLLAVSIYLTVYAVLLHRSLSNG